MARHWNWDFEDDDPAERQAPRKPAPPQRAPRPPAPPAPPPGGRPPSREAQIRRRRIVAVVVALAVIIGLVAVLASASHKSQSASERRLAKAAKIERKPLTAPEHDQNAAVASVLAYTPFVREGSGSGHDVALTFDDGPGPYTPGVLSVLERFHVHATFFVVGRMLEYFSSSTVRAIEDGDAIGNHTEDHPALAQLSLRDQREQLAEATARVELVGGHPPVLFRPPYGSFNQTTLRELKARHLLMVLWSTDTDDFRQPGVEAIVSTALEGAKPGAIILMHDGGGNREQTIAALPEVIRGIQAKGLRLVTVPELLMDEPPPAGQSLPTNLSGG
jgi:peptidoglycan-N-acetylglucosamine deacetylase